MFKKIAIIGLVLAATSAHADIWTGADKGQHLMAGAAILGAIGVAIAAISAWLRINNKDGSGWAILAFCLLVTSCQQITP